MSRLGEDCVVGDLRVALLQLLAAGNDPTVNLAKGLDACRQAATLGADIALFPEMWSIGYYAWGEAGHGPDELAALAIGEHDIFVRQFQDLARELEMAIAITYLETWPSAPRNTVSLIDRTGEIVLTYAKVHTCDFGDEACLTPGTSFPVASLHTRVGPVNVGAMICFDLLFPEAARILTLGGAEVILVPNASRKDDNHRLCLRARAHENMVAIALANYASPQQGGGSLAIDAVSYDIGDDGRALDPVLLQAEDAEAIHIATYDLDRIRAFRAAETQGDAYRKPATYTALLRANVDPPFARADSRR